MSFSTHCGGNIRAAWAKGHRVYTHILRAGPNTGRWHLEVVQTPDTAPHLNSDALVRLLPNMSVREKQSDFSSLSSDTTKNCICTTCYSVTLPSTWWPVEFHKQTRVFVLFVFLTALQKWLHMDKARGKHWVMSLWLSRRMVSDTWLQAGCCPRTPGFQYVSGSSLCLSKITHY